MRKVWEQRTFRAAAAIVVLGASAVALAEERLVQAYLIIKAPPGPVSGRCLIKGKVRGTPAELNRTTVYVTRAKVTDTGVLVSLPGVDDEGLALGAKGEFELPMESGPRSLIIESGSLSLRSLVSGCGLEVEASVAQAK